MIDIGVATSIAKKYDYSWQFTIEFCLKQGLDSIQFYMPTDYIIPNIPSALKIANKYLHLPPNFLANETETFQACDNFVSYYRSNKLIMHQNDSYSPDRLRSIILAFNHKEFQIGLENDGNNSIENYYNLLHAYLSSNMNVFPVLDVHRFFHDFYKIFHFEIILDMIIRILNLCARFEKKVVLHIVDSTTFSSDRLHWCNVFQGLVPYRDIFNYINRKQILIETIIFEYEAENITIESIKKIKEKIIIFSKN